MKQFKVLVALVLAMMMTLALCSSAMAGTLTITRNDSYSADSGDREYTWYKIFDVSPTTNVPSGGGVNNAGDPGDINNTATTAAYTATAAVAAILDNSTLSPANTWFKTTAIAGTTNKAVAWDTAVTINAATTQAAAKWLVENGAYTDHGSFTASGSSFTPENNFGPGYYVIVPSEGDNYIALTMGSGDATINEKNTYPTIDKKQKDDETSNYGDDSVNVKIGDTIYYQVVAKVPADANKDIVVTDTMSTGLTFGDNVVVTVGDAVDSAAAISNDGNVNYVASTKSGGDSWTWQYTIHATAATRGKYVVFTFTGIVNTDALTSTDRKNDVELNYNNGHYIDTDHVEFDIGAAAIIKYDGATADLNQTDNTLSPKTGSSIKYLEATFALTDSNGGVNVTAVTTGVYKVDPNGTDNKVTSDKDHNGVILIYGLDPAVQYTLTETATEDGYNLLDGTVTLTTVIAHNSDVNTIKVVVDNVDGISAGNTTADAANTLTLNAKQVSKVANNSGTVLPSTGGIGTTIFYVAGLILVLGAATILVARRKAESDAE